MPEQSQVFQNYAQLVRSLWEDATLLEALKANPHSVLSQYGLTIPADAPVNLIFHDLGVHEAPSIRADMLIQAEETGVYNIILPNKPASSDAADLPLNEEVLEMIAGGTIGVDSCCCCPCCCVVIE